VSSAVTEGIRVEVVSAYRPDRSDPSASRWLFTYTASIRNEGENAARLVSRHWIITDANGDREEVQGDGVVGHQPHLGPGQSFDYTSFCILKTPHGSMRGSYRMVRDDGSTFDAAIAPFPLVVPGSLN
jgi:ApaG protein